MANITKRGNSYRVRVSNGRDSSGKQLFESATFTPDPARTEKQNQKALEAFVFEFEQKVKSGKYLDGEKLTFKAFSETWITDHAEKTLEITTVQSYRDLLTRCINPAIGHLKIARIQPVHLNKLYLSMSDTRKDGKPGGYSSATIRRVHALISSVFSTAVKWNVITESPCGRVTLPKTAPIGDRVKCFTPEQAGTFLEALDAQYSGSDGLGTQYRLLFNLALYSGARRGELIALEWSDIDFDNMELSITKSAEKVKGEVITKAPKTRTSYRRVSLPASVVTLARKWKIEQLQYRLSIGSQWNGSNYVFIQWDGSRMYPDTPTKIFNKIIARHNAAAPDNEQLPRITLHDLRHTSATLLIAQNVDIRTVSSRLGHAKTSTTMNIYAHALQQKDREAANALDDLLTRKA